MIAVIFEVVPAPGRQDDYLALAAQLKSELVQIDGFVSVERFRSLSEPDKLLSLSWFRNEAAVRQWRSHMQHRDAQAQGRQGIFLTYRIRVASLIRDYGMHDRSQAPGNATSD
ncbi:MAG: antibiotic biosynthesis monooxygenase [Burkholderiales bacterium]|nr:MAG: antibiotic biosynthesis monooxygenase [Burkholderiales bacterium]